MPSMSIPSRIPILSLLSPPIAATGMGTARHISASVSVEVRTVLTLVVVGNIAPTPR